MSDATGVDGGDEYPSVQVGCVRQAEGSARHTCG